MRSLVSAVPLPLTPPLRRGERREDYIHVTTVYLTGTLTHPVPVGAPVTITGAVASRPRSGRVTYWAAPDGGRPEHCGRYGPGNR